MWPLLHLVSHMWCVIIHQQMCLVHGHPGQKPDHHRRGVREHGWDCAGVHSLDWGLKVDPSGGFTALAERGSKLSGLPVVRVSVQAHSQLNPTSI